MVLSVPLSETKLTSDVACPTQSINQGLWVKALSLGFSTFFKFRDMMVLIAASPIIGWSWLSLQIIFLPSSSDWESETELSSKCLFPAIPISEARGKQEKVMRSLSGDWLLSAKRKGRVISSLYFSPLCYAHWRWIGFQANTSILLLFKVQRAGRSSGTCVRILFLYLYFF